MDMIDVRLEKNNLSNIKRSNWDIFMQYMPIPFCDTDVFVALEYQDDNWYTDENNIDVAELSCWEFVDETQELYIYRRNKVKMLLDTVGVYVNKNDWEQDKSIFVQTDFSLDGLYNKVVHLNYAQVNFHKHFKYI